MAVRSIKLKLKSRSGKDSEQLRKGLWKTHQRLNEGIKYYMNWLVAMRQDSYGDYSKAEVQLNLLSKIREQQKRNGWDGETGKDGEILSLLRQLYELILPSSVGGSGDAQMLARKFLSPLVDPNSKGGEGTSKAGRKPGWLKKKELGDPTWEEDYKKDIEKKDADPTADVLIALKSFGLKPLFPMFTDEQTEIEWIPKKKGQFVRNLDRDMFQQAIEKMLSWESWNQRVALEYQKLQEKMNSFYEKNLAGGQEWVQQLRVFEANREIELEKDAFASNDRYVITSRQIRGWDRIFEKWNTQPADVSEEKLWELVAKEQTKMSGGFGDAKVFQFLAKRENHFIWRNHPERLYQFAAYNVLDKKLKHAKTQAAFTLPDAVHHPLWVRYDARGGNLHSYIIQSFDNKRMIVKFDSMIWPKENGWFEKKDVEVELAPSEQFYRQIDLQDNPDGKQEIEFKDYSSGIPLEGVLGGAKIQFDRRYLEKHWKTVTAGDVGPVFLNLVVDLTPMQEMKNGRLRTPVGQALKVVPTDWPKVIEFKPEELYQWIKSTPVTTTLGVSSITTGMRIMTVDMGQRTSAAVSIFEVRKDKPTEQETKLYFPITETNLYAVHQRSLLLNLPGEDVSRKKIKIRRNRRNFRVGVRSQTRLLSQILRLHTKTVDQREESITELIESISNTERISQPDKMVWIEEVSSLQKYIIEDLEQWKRELTAVHQKLEPLVGQTVSSWRKSLSENRRGIAGLSMWNIDELEDTRKLLVSWSKRARQPGEVNRLERNEKFRENQLTHLQNVKDDRLKQMANLIVMTALGYKYDEAQKRWIQAYPACQVILFEDLTRYRFNQDRAPRENSRLMKWAHRSIPKMVFMQGEPYGLQVGDVYSAFSSRFHAKTGAPGIRCHPLTVDDLEEGRIPKKLVEQGFLKEDQIKYLQPGHIVPWRSGELFVTLAARFSDNLATIHADINAAQNLQKRFWQKNSEIFRVSCQVVTTGEEEFLVPKYQSKTLQKLLGKGRFVKFGESNNENVYKWENSTKLKIKTTSTEEISELEGMEDFLQSLEEAEEVRGDYKTLFCDPSGFFFNKNTWIPQKDFWIRVNSMIEKRLREKILSKVEV